MPGPGEPAGHDEGLAGARQRQPLHELRRPVAAAVCASRLPPEPAAAARRLPPAPPAISSFSVIYFV